MSRQVEQAQVEQEQGKVSGSQQIAGREAVAASPIRARTFADGPNADTPRYWFAGDPFMTHFYNAISSMFPEGERFFIRSVRNYSDKISSPELKIQVRAFVQQEAAHYKEHENHATLLEAQGFKSLARLNRFAKASLEWSSSTFPRFSLASTAATEHITAALADQILRRDDLWLKPMATEMHRLWLWHAIEESEHKAVAFDVYQECVEQGQLGGLWLRRLAMAQVLVVFFAETAFRHSLLLAKDRQFTPAVLIRGLRLLLGKNGLLRAFHPQMWHFFRRDFHPWQYNNVELVESSLGRLKLQPQ